MSFISRIIRFLFWVLILSWGVALVRRAIAWLLRDASARPQQGKETVGSSEMPGIPRRLVRDPVCGVHVAEVMAVPLRDGGQTLHFCSVACRDKYVGGIAKIAANG
jgi:YHS domain-containing protein